MSPSIEYRLTVYDMICGFLPNVFDWTVVSISGEVTVAVPVNMPRHRMENRNSFLGRLQFFKPKVWSADAQLAPFSWISRSRGDDGKTDQRIPTVV